MYSVIKAAESDFTPISHSLLHFRRQNLELFRRAVNTIVYENRAKKNLLQL